MHRCNRSTGRGLHTPLLSDLVRGLHDPWIRCISFGRGGVSDRERSIPPPRSCYRGSLPSSSRRKYCAYSGRRIRPETWLSSFPVPYGPAPHTPRSWSCSPVSAVLFTGPRGPPHGPRGPLHRSPRSCSPVPRSCSPFLKVLILLPGPPRSLRSCFPVRPILLPVPHGPVPWYPGVHLPPWPLRSYSLAPWSYHPGLYGPAPPVPTVLLAVPAVLDLLLQFPTVLLPVPPGPDPAPRSHGPGPVLRSLRSCSPYPTVLFHGIPRSCSPWSLRSCSTGPHSPAPRSRGPGPAPRSHSPVPWYPAVLLLGLHGPGPAPLGMHGPAAPWLSRRRPAGTPVRKMMVAVCIELGSSLKQGQLMSPLLVTHRTAIFI
ncbi:unnamed protein product [Bemisia tabaci]|uniref:Uncharacterized protein n=1 Tax=Bemisia tabaci TaxID=7038 RepID=A0AAI8Y5T6_BEMTA|nr:unnamed protein product [Bemisia tabaci]